MASNLRVDTILPSTGTSLGIGTASGTTTITGNLVASSASITGNLGVAGVLTYEDVTNVDSVGVITARNGGYLDIRTGSSINTNVTGASASGTLHKNTNSGEFAVVSGGTGGNNHLSFYTSASAAPTEKLRISSTGNVTANTGNIIIGTAGKGIDFSAQTATSASGATTTGETLVHYEEGTWTATLYGNSTRTNTDTTTSTTNRAVTGTYRKIGSLVYVQALWTGLHNGGGNDMFNHQLQRIEGLPFPSSNASGTSKFTSALGYNRGIYAAYGSNVQNDAIFYFFLGTNSTTVYPQASLVLQNSPGTLFHITSNTTSTIYYAFQMTYHTN